MKYPKSLIVTTVCLAAFGLNAQNIKQQDQAAIKAMCGCYEVGFNFTETFNYAQDSTYRASEVKHEGALEWVQLVEDEENKIVMQHLLIVGKAEEPHIIKHWRQDWLYENTDFYVYDHDNQWKFDKKSPKEVEGQWTQKVFQVDDSPRYEGSATWVHVDGKDYWENTTDAPLPRREYTKRDDYNVTVRSNRHEITSYGWLHEQDNNKVIRTKGREDVLLAQEKGYNTYKKVADTKCKAAQNWWKENDVLWQQVRDNWADIFTQNTNLYVRPTAGGKPLYEYLNELKPTTSTEEVKKIINDFVTL